jgi:hypothetical protein
MLTIDVKLDAQYFKTDFPPQGIDAGIGPISEPKRSGDNDAAGDDAHKEAGHKKPHGVKYLQKLAHEHFLAQFERRVNR